MTLSDLDELLRLMESHEEVIRHQNKLIKRLVTDNEQKDELLKELGM